MTARTVKEWIGATPDTKPPPRVLLRIFQRENGMCYLSGRKIAPGEKWQADHKIALINGGANIESNLFPVLVAAHAEKTKLDVAEKSRVADRAKSHLGIRTRPVAKIRSAPMPISERTARREPKPPATGQSGIARQYRSAT